MAVGNVIKQIGNVGGPKRRYTSTEVKDYLAKQAEIKKAQSMRKGGSGPVNGPYGPHEAVQGPQGANYGPHQAVQGPQLPSHKGKSYDEIREGRAKARKMRQNPSQDPGRDFTMVGGEYSGRTSAKAPELSEAFQENMHKHVHNSEQKVKAQNAASMSDRSVRTDGYGNMTKDWGSNLRKEYGSDGKMASGWDIGAGLGKHALRGAVVGGAIGGTTEYAQGGSFWAGAKSGAFDGAVGYAGYRGVKAATGATSSNPFGREGAFGKGFGQIKSTYQNTGGVSNAVKKIQDNAAMSNLSSKVMNQ